MLGGGKAWRVRGTDGVGRGGEGGGEESEPPARVAELRRLLVVPEWRGRGVGAGLLAHAERYIDKTYGATVVYVSRRLELVHGFLRRRGYEVVDEFDNEWCTDKLQRI